jgi:hypothetical protein
MRDLDIHGIAVAAAILLASACGKSTEWTPPGSPTPTNPLTRTLTIRIVDGWSNAVVIGGIVSANGVERSTDSEGRVTVQVQEGSCSGIAVRAAGFLERRTCSFSNTVSLWPVADETEVAATRAAAFRDDVLRVWPDISTVYLGFLDELIGRTDIHDVWRSAGNHIRDVTNGRVTFGIELGNIWSDWVIRQASPSPNCILPVPWPLDVGGFCADRDGYDLQVTATGLTDPAVATRALASAILLGPHDMPGLLNRQQPANDFSAFERKTLQMMALRLQARVGLVWPDFDAGWH